MKVAPTPEGAPCAGAWSGGPRPFPSVSSRHYNQTRTHLALGKDGELSKDRKPL
jgi:hypothetical protein